MTRSPSLALYALGALASLASLAPLTGCKRPTESGAGSPQTLTISGSNSMLPFVESWAETYAKGHPELKINVQGGGSTSGVKAALSGTAQIGDCSRALTPEEAAQGLIATVVARDGLSVVVHKDNSVSALTLAQVKDIFTGKVKNWKEVGGPDLSMTVITREEGSGARGSFEELALNKERVAASAIVSDSTGGIREMVSHDPHAIAFGTMGQMSSDVKSVSIDGVPATEDNVRSGKYLLVHPFTMLTKGAPAGPALTFITFMLSPEGQALVIKAGLIPAR